MLLTKLNLHKLDTLGMSDVRANVPAFEGKLNFVLSFYDISTTSIDLSA